MTTKRTAGRQPGSMFGNNALAAGGLGAMTPAQRQARREWIANSLAREAQLSEIAGASLSGCSEGSSANVTELLKQELG